MPAAVRALAASHPYIDLSRVGVWGWSGGGSNTLNCMFRFPDVYSVGVSVAPVPDQRLYDTIYQERYMGLPQENAEGYKIGSPINFAEGLKGKLLVIHGSGDDNVHFQGTERLINRLVELGKPVQHQPLELRHLGRVDAVVVGPEMGEVAEHPADGVAQLAVGVDGGLEDLRPDAQIVRIIGSANPHAQDVGAGGLDHVLRRHSIAERL